MLFLRSGVTGEGGLAGVHADGAYGQLALCRFLSRRETRRQRVVRRAREDLGRRERSRGEQLCLGVEGGGAVAGFGAGSSIYCSGGGVSEEGGLAGDGSFEYGVLLRDRPGREACRQRGIGHVRQDLGRRDRSRG